MATDRIGITLPQELRQRVDDQANKWMSDRSSAISRMLQEWFARNQNGQIHTHPEKNGVSTSTPAA